MAKRPKAPAGCFWRGPTLWARLRLKGGDRRWSLRSGDPKIAKQRYAEEKERIVNEVVYGVKPAASIDQGLALWVPWLESSVKSPKTRLRYACSMAQLKPFLTGKTVDEIDGALIREIIAGRRSDDVTYATIKRDLGALSSFMNFCVLEGWREFNPVLPRLRLLKEERDPIILPEPADIEKVIARAGGNLAKLLLTAWRTGCRQEELVTAERSRVDHKLQQLTVVGKGNKLRVIDLKPFGGYDAIKSVPAFVGKRWLFWDEGGEEFKEIWVTHYRLCRKIAAEDETFRPFPFHNLRHRHAVDWLKAGRSIYDLQQRLGHSSVKTTEIYLAYLTPQEERVAKFGAA